MYQTAHRLSGPQPQQRQCQKIHFNRIWFVEVASVQAARNKRLEIRFDPARMTEMEACKQQEFYKRFIAPITKNDVGKNLLAAVDAGSHDVFVAWGNGRFGFTGTTAWDKDANHKTDGTGSNVVIFIDEQAPDWQSMPTITANPDVGFFHELVHACLIQRGRSINDEEELERRVIGLGKYMDAKGTENDYRNARSLSRRWSWKKETLEGLGEPFSPAVFTDADKDLAASAAQGGVSDANALADRVFFARHPERNGKRIDPRLEADLAAEWNGIKSGLVLPILDALDANEKGKQALMAGQAARAISFFDHARRVAAAPARSRAAATLNLGLASLSAQRFAAAIGYFEIARTFPGVPKDFRDKADRLFDRAKQEYKKAVP